jgi:hypothetical protein
MTPEQLQELPGIEPDMVETLQAAVVSYYSQFETEQNEAAAAPPAEAPPAGIAAPPVEAVADQSVTIETQDSSPNTETGAAEKGE